MQQSEEKVGLAFIHGAGLNNGIWSEVVEGLDHPHLLLEFPHRQGKVDAQHSLADYTAPMTRQLEEWNVRKFVLVTHSLGGVLGMKLAAQHRDRLAGFVGVGAAIPRDGGSFLSTLPLPKRMILPLMIRMLGTRPPESAIRAGLCNGLPSAQADRIVQSFTPESVRVYLDRADASIPDVPKLYVKLTEDNEFGSALQDAMIASLAPQGVKSLDAGHLPMLANPNGLKIILNDFMKSLQK